ncbi:MAG TPA: S41 family peptidase, partial [Polyangiales bacterium]|nr:S41 family peptidase [Polyangiales bacterium]
ALGVEHGDELVSIDGTPAEQAVAAYLDYAGFPRAETRRQFAASMLTYRPSWSPGSVVASGHSVLRLRKANGEEQDVELPWLEQATHPLTDTEAPRRDASMLAESRTAARMLAGEFSGFSNRQPFYLTSQVEQAYEWTEQIAPSAAALTAFNVQASVAAQLDYYARRYRFGGKTFLLLRIHSYHLPDGVRPTDALNYLSALLLEQAPRVDGLVLDQTHNGGGDIWLAELVAGLLSAKPVRALVEAVHADRRSLDTYLRVAEQLRSAAPFEQRAAWLEAAMNGARQIDAANSANQPLTAPIPLVFPPVTSFETNPNHWTKPFIVLADELSASAADFLPLLVEANELGPVFGQRTAGAGADVERVLTLTNAQLDLYVPRGLITVYDPSRQYSDEDLVEDEGVTPTFEYTHDVDDFRAGYVPYVEAFSRQLLASIR